MGKSYYINFSVICIGSLVLSYGLSQLQTRYLQTAHYWVPTLFFALATVGINAVVTRGEKQSKEFIFKTLALTMGRLLLCMIVVFIYSLINKAGTLAFACHFMIQYIIFTLFEISFLLKYIKQPNKTDNNQLTQ